MSSTNINVKSIFANGKFLETVINPNDNAITRLYKKFSIEFEEAYYLNAAIAIMLQSVIGGIAAMFVLANMKHSAFGMVELGLAVGVSSLFNALILGQIKPKLVFIGLIISIVVNTILIAINI